MSLSDQLSRGALAGRDFASTHWSLVLLAGGKESPQSAAALESLCRAYWYPLYSFTRRQGYSPHEAADLTQSFFSHILSTGALASVHPQKGKFRSFLLACLKNLLANDWHRAQCQKRGGGVPTISLDEEQAESRYRLEPADALTPDRIFERCWAETLLARALDRLREECDAAEKGRRFEELKLFLLGEREAGSMAKAAETLGLSLSAAKALVHRLRRRFRELIRAEIAQTVSQPGEIDQEIRDLFAAFGD